MFAAPLLIGALLLPSAMPGMAGEMESAARLSLIARCGAAPRCAAYSRQDGVEPRIRISDISCREAKHDRVRVRHCTFAAHSAARPDRLKCRAEFHEWPGEAASPWSDRQVIRTRGVFLPTSGKAAPMQLGASTLSCSGSPFDYVS
ncbi:MAG: hypothetical protein ACJ8ER_01425 [Allosphingosinicella sp.]